MILRRKDRRRTGVVAALCLPLAACASTSGAPQSQQASLLQSERPMAVPDFDQRQQASLVLAEVTRMEAAPHSKQSIYYLGLALYSETWSQNDVVELDKELPASVPTFSIRSMILSNYTAGGSFQYPLASYGTMYLVAHYILAHSRPDDLVVVAVSTHGGRGLLAQKVGQVSLPSLSAEDFRRSLAPLVDRRTIIILSSCFAASLIPSLKMDNRIIIAAARSDRTSFGCKADAEHTVFGQAIIDAFSRSNQSLHTIFDAVRAEVSATEAERHFLPPSEPEVFVGNDMQQLYDAQMF
jgi:hypothetical protein